MLLAREQGLPVVAVGALVQRPLTSLIATRKSGVRCVRDLRGKRVGTAGIPYQSAYLKTILGRAKVPESSVKETNVGASLLPAMLSGKVDATLGGFWNVEGVELQPAPASDPGSRPWTGSGCPTTTSWCWSPRGRARTTKRDDLRLFISARSREARSRPARDPRGAARADRRQPRPEGARRPARACA